MKTGQPVTGNKDWIISATLNKLIRKGYTLKFRRETDCLYCLQWQSWITPANFTVDNYYYFEDVLNPDAERILYAISLLRGGKGYLVDTCHAYTGNISQVMMQKLKINKTKTRSDVLAGTGEGREPAKLINEALTF